MVKPKALTTTRPTQVRRLWTQFKYNRLSVFGLLFVITLTLASIIGPFLLQDTTGTIQLGSNLLPPSFDHPLGTDELGRDLLARIVEGARLSLTIGLVSVTIALLVGVPFGSISAYAGGWIDMLLMRLVDILLTFPTILTAIIIVTIIGPSLTGAMLAIGLTQVPIITRLTRALVLSLKEREFVTAGRAMGVTRQKLLFRHILPNCVSPLIVQASLLMASAILSAAYLGFLGLGAQPPSPEWGAMVANGRGYLRTATHVAIVPGLAIMLTVLALNAIGDGLRDALDPQSSRSKN